MYATFAAQTQLFEINKCAVKNYSAVIVPGFDPASADIVFRLGQPSHLTTPSFQVDTEDILVVVNRIHAFNNLTAEQVKGLFAGRISTWSLIDPSKPDAVQVWVYPSGEDVEQAFEQITLGGSPVTSNARLAASPDEMSQAIANDENAIGLMPRHLKMGNISDVFVAATVPVLAITPSEPHGVVADLLTCLQH